VPLIHPQLGLHVGRNNNAQALLSLQRSGAARETTTAVAGFTAAIIKSTAPVGTGDEEVSNLWSLRAFSLRCRAVRTTDFYKALRLRCSGAIGPTGWAALLHPSIISVSRLADVRRRALPEG